MTKICKHCGHAKCYHLTPKKQFRETEPYCEFCAEQIHTDPKEREDMATHEFEESI